MEKIELLRELYADVPQPVLLFRDDFQIFWLNEAAIHQFPTALEGMDIRDLFTTFTFEGLNALPSEISSVTLHARDGKEQVAVMKFEDQGGLLYAAIWSEMAVYHLEPEDRQSAEGVELMDAWIRQGVFRIFNHLDRLNLALEKAGSTAGWDSVERIERNCQQLLRLGMNLDGYYGGTAQAGALAETVMMADYLEELFREVDFRLGALGITLERTIRCGGAACRIDKRRFTAALLNLIDLSAAYAPEGGSMEITCTRSETDFCLTFCDAHTPAGVLKGGLSCVIPSVEQGRSELCLPKISLGFLDRVVRECGGRCLLDGGKAGMKAVIRLPLSDEPVPIQVQDEAAYTVRYRGQNRTSLVSILLSDLGE